MMKLCSLNGRLRTEKHSRFSRKIGAAKELLGLGSILIVSSRHAETVVLMSRI